MPKQRVHAHNLVLDKPLPWDVYDDTGALLLCKGYRLTRESQREVLAARGLYVEGLPVSTARPSATPAYNPFRLWDTIIDELEVLLRNIRQEADFPRQIESLARLIQELARRSADTALAAIVLTDQRRYPVIHSVHVAILCEMVASRLGWLPDRRISLICAALTQNLAMLELQLKLCAQRVAPSPAQRQEIQRHPALAEEMLREAGVKDPLWLRAVVEHHEHEGGGGYPYGITSPSEEALLIQTADVFTAKLSPRGARKPITAQEAARTLYLESTNGEHGFSAVLIKETGIFPPGSFVLLTNKELALVTHRGGQANTPRALALVSPQGMSYAQPLQRDTARREYAVASVVPRELIKVRIDPERIWQAC